MNQKYASGLIADAVAAGLVSASVAQALSATAVTVGLDVDQLALAGNLAARTGRGYESVLGNALEVAISRGLHPAVQGEAVFRFRLRVNDSLLTHLEGHGECLISAMAVSGLHVLARTV